MRELQARPDLGQLRRQARELLRAAQDGDGDAEARLAAVDAPPTLAGAQLALAREHGFGSWARMKQAVEARRGELRFVIRYARSLEELHRLWVAVNLIFGHDPPPGEREHWHVFDDFDVKRTTMLVVEHQGRIVGGTIERHLIALEPWARGIGLGTALLQVLDAETLALGKRLGFHADPDNKGFFMKNGYSASGKSKRHMYKGAPSGRVLTRRLELWRSRVGDLDAGLVVEVDPQTGRIPPLRPL